MENGCCGVPTCLFMSSCVLFKMCLSQFVMFQTLKAETYFMDLLLCFDKARGGGLVKEHMQYGGIGGVSRCFLSLEEPGREMDTS